MSNESEEADDAYRQMDAKDFLAFSISYLQNVEQMSLFLRPSDLGIVVSVLKNKYDRWEELKFEQGSNSDEVLAEVFPFEKEDV